MKSFEEFKADLESGDLREELAKLCDSNRGLSYAEREKLIRDFAKEKGYEISIEDYTLMEADKQVLDDAELNRMSSGGLYPHLEGREGCVADYACYINWNTCWISDECGTGQDCAGNVWCNKNDYCGMHA